MDRAMTAFMPCACDCCKRWSATVSWDDLIARSAGTERASATPPKETAGVAAPEALRGALQRLYDETADYIRINNLGPVHPRP